GNGCGPRSSSCSIGKSLTLGASQDAIGASQVVISSLDAIGVTEVELGQVALQMDFTNVLVNAIDATLQDTEIPLNGVGVDIASHVFLSVMIDRAMAASEVPADATVDIRAISHEAAISVGVQSEDRMQGSGGHVRNMEAANLAAALQQSHDDLLRWGGTVST